LTDHLEGIINAWKLDGVMVVILILAICLLLGMVLESM
jgi:hypothetical protein